jgi:hypothetical protein
LFSNGSSRACVSCCPSIASASTRDISTSSLHHSDEQFVPKNESTAAESQGKPVEARNCFGHELCCVSCPDSLQRVTREARHECQQRFARQRGCWWCNRAGSNSASRSWLRLHSCM